MLPLKNRLYRHDFTAVFKQGKRVRGNFFSLVLLFNENSGDSQIGIQIAKKTFPNAVKRNLFKKRLRNILIAEILPRLAENYKIIILTFPPKENLKFSEIKAEILALFEKNGLNLLTDKK